MFDSRTSSDHKWQREYSWHAHLDLNKQQLDVTLKQNVVNFPSNYSLLQAAFKLYGGIGNVFCL